MHAGGHHEPSVLTHFLPGMVLGIVLGGITGTLVVAHIASTSLQFFWEASRTKEDTPLETCGDSSLVETISVSSENTTALTAITIGNAPETLLTIPHERLRVVVIGNETTAYLTAVTSADQRDAFPATSLYRIDYCKKTLTHLLGNAEEPTRILGVSPSGEWVLYQKERLLLMNTKEHRVMSLVADGEVTDVTFSQANNGGAVLFADGSGVVWSFSNDHTRIIEDVVITKSILPPWTFQSPEVYAGALQ